MGVQVCLERISGSITGNIENFFYFWGLNIATRPFKFIIGCLVLTIFCCCGLLNFHRETKTAKLFVPYGSRFYNTTNWLKETFPPPIRQEFVIITDDDVLTPVAVQQMLKVHQRVSNFNISSGKSWKDLCFKFPVVKDVDSDIFKGVRHRIITKRDINADDDSKKFHDFDDFEEEFAGETFHLNNNTNSSDFSITMPRHLYCGIVDSIPKECWEFSLLELWNYDPQVIANLSKQDIVHTLNNVKKSPVFGSPTDYTALLGDSEMDQSGQIIRAKSLMTVWHIEVNDSNLIRSDGGVFDGGASDPVDADSYEWEGVFIKIGIQLADESEKFNGPDVLVRAWRSISDVMVETMKDGIVTFLMAYSTMFVYILFMFCEFNILELKVMSATMGVTAVGLAFISSVGLCSAIGLSFGPLHNNIGVLLLGLGVDDMFVITQCWSTLSDKDKCTKTIPEKMGLTMKHAGMSITVTSLTNFVAFSVGSTTIYPSISSMCIYTAVGIVTVFIFQSTYFVAWFSLEQKRIAANKNPILCCITQRKQMKTTLISPREFLQRLFDKFAPYLTKWPVKILILLVNLVFLGLGAWGTYHLETRYELEWIMPKDSYLQKVGNVMFSQYKTHGEEGFFTLDHLNYTTDMKVIEDFVTEVKNQTDIIITVEDWYTDFKEYVNTNFNEDVPNHLIPHEKFMSYLGQFLFSPNGAQHQKSFKFKDTPKCEGNAPPFNVSLIPFRFVGFNNIATKHVPAMQRIRAIVDNVNVTTPEAWVSVWAYTFLLWECDETVYDESIRNIMIASICIFFTTVIALVNLPASLMVMSCVILTIVEVMGFMHWWNIPLNIITQIILIMCIGLSVDFAAHIAYSFMSEVGGRSDRTIKGFRHIAPAIFNGAFSTLLAFLFFMRAGSTGLVMVFKIFLLVIMFGIYEGLLFLPVILSIFGPAPYPHLVKGLSNVESDELNKLSEKEYDFIGAKMKKGTEKDRTEDNEDTKTLPEEEILNTRNNINGHD